MNVLLFGATGMVGQGVLRECLLDPEVRHVLSIGRNLTGQQHPKFREIAHKNFLDFSSLEKDLSNFDACFWCLGVSSVGMPEARYREITYEYTMALAQVAVRLNPAMTFIYVTGMGTDGTEQGRVAWARVKGATENALLRLPFKAAYMFRPAAIVPMHGIRSKTAVYQVFYNLLRPILPFLYAKFPKYFTTTEQIGLAMLKLAKGGRSKAVLENADINVV